MRTSSQDDIMRTTSIFSDRGPQRITETAGLHPAVSLFRGATSRVPSLIDSLVPRPSAARPWSQPVPEDPAGRSAFAVPVRAGLEVAARVRPVSRAEEAPLRPG